MTDCQAETELGPLATARGGFAAAAPPWWSLLPRRWAGRLAAGELTLQFPGGASVAIAGREPGPRARMNIHRPALAWKLLSGGELGLARSHIDGDWDSPDLAALFDLGVANQAALDRELNKPPAGMLARLRHRRRANTRAGSRRNIAFHYDLGNPFYAAWLDASMTYSAALYERPDLSLHDAQLAKYDRIIGKLGLRPGDHVLEIGCGWGGFAERAAATVGCTVTGLTLSQEQARFARERAENAGLADRIRIRLEDYRDCVGQFDHIVSIEMFEAVGEENWPVYFSALRRLLKPGGRAMLQIITIDDACFDAYRRRADFIQTYVFPGGMLPSPTKLSLHAAEAGFGVADTLWFGRDYERTLNEWQRAFDAAWPRIAIQGFDERFARLWRYYLQYCAAGFRSGRIDVGHFLLAPKS